MQTIADLYYTRTEASYRLGISNSFMYILEKTGQVKAVERVGKQKLYLKTEIDRLAEERGN
jgi:hypothetical protein